MNRNHGLLLVLIMPALAAAGCGSGGSRESGSDAGSTVTLLGNGKVLVFGGETPQEDPVSTVMLFE